MWPQLLHATKRETAGKRLSMACAWHFGHSGAGGSVNRRVTNGFSTFSAFMHHVIKPVNKRRTVRVRRRTVQSQSATQVHADRAVKRPKLERSSIAAQSLH